MMKRTIVFVSVCCIFLLLVFPLVPALQYPFAVGMKEANMIKELRDKQNVGSSGIIQWLWSLFLAILIEILIRNTVFPG